MSTMSASWYLCSCDTIPYLFEEMRMGWERRMDGESAIRGARVRVELPNKASALPADASLLSEPSNTSVQGPATSIMLPEGRIHTVSLHPPGCSRRWRSLLQLTCPSLVKSTCKLWLTSICTETHWEPREVQMNDNQENITFGRWKLNSKIHSLYGIQSSWKLISLGCSLFSGLLKEHRNMWENRFIIKLWAN